MILAALTAGLITSIHCIGMCGPLACAVCPKLDQSGKHWLALPAYHAGRIISYTMIGFVLGWVGASIQSLLSTEIPEILPWAFIALFCIIFLGWEKNGHSRNGIGSCGYASAFLHQRQDRKQHCC